MQHDLYWLMIREALNLELEFASFRDIKSPVSQHPRVTKMSATNAEVEVPLLDAKRAIVRIEFDLSGVTPNPLHLRYQHSGHDEVYQIREYPGSHLATWFIPVAIDETLLAPMDDIGRHQALIAYQQQVTQST